MEKHPVEGSKGSGQLYYSDLPEHKQAVTWARSHHSRNSASSTERWCLLQRGVLSLILPAPFKSPNQSNHALSPGSGEFQLQWVLSQKRAPVWFLRGACPQEKEQGGFFCSTTPCITHLGAQYLWGLHQICYNEPRNWTITKRGAGGSRRSTWVAMQQVMHGERADWETLQGTYHPGFQNHWTNIKPNYS